MDCSSHRLSYTERDALPKNIQVVLVKPTHQGNIGACARAMRVMGLNQLVLVEAPTLMEEAFARAAGAQDVLLSAQRSESVASAVGGAHYVLASSARRRVEGMPVLGPREAAEKVVHLASAGQAISILFGCEQHGLSNEAMAMAHEQIVIPILGAYQSLNLSMALQILTYELCMAWKQYAQPLNALNTLPSHPSTIQAKRSQLRHLEQAIIDLLTRLGYRPDQGKLLGQIRRMLLDRPMPSYTVNSLIGIAKRLLINLTEPTE